MTKRKGMNAGSFDRSEFLAKVIGFYLVIIGLVMVVNMQSFLTFAARLVNDQSLMFFSGFVTLILGLLMVIAHNKWVYNWRVIITIVAWITLLKGISLILYPNAISKTTITYVQNIKNMYLTISLDFLFGIILLYFGYKR